MRNFKDLEVWKNARILSRNIYVLTATFPSSEKFGLTSQIRRCAISIAANIAEGAAKESSKDFARFLEISQGSCFELESHLILANDVDIITEKQFMESQEQIIFLQKRIYNFIKYIRSKQ